MALLFLLVFGASYFLKTRLPDIAEINQALFQQPIQGKTDKENFTMNKGGIGYSIEPKYSYELWGLIVSVNNNEVWYSRFKKSDPLNNKDICVVWDANLKNDIYKNFSYSSAEYVCYAKSKSGTDATIIKQFKSNNLSNNHLLPDTDEIYEKVKSAKIGDQIHLKGYLASYSSKNKDGQTFSRGTSISRDDDGNGACETIYVKQFDILKSENNLATSIGQISLYLFIISTIISIILLFFPTEKIIHDGDIIRAEETKYSDLLPPKR